VSKREKGAAMYNVMDESRPLEHLFSGMPPGLVSSEEWTRMITFCRDMDNVGRVDVQTGEAYCDEASLHVLLGHFLPRTVVNQGIAKLKSVSGGKIVTTTFAQGQTSMTLMPVRWLDLAKRIPGFKPSSDFTFGDLGISSSSTPLDIQRAVQQKFPGIPDQLFDLPTLKQRLQPLIGESASSAEHAAPAITLGGIWNCLVSNVGFWTALGLYALAGFLIGLAAGPAAPIIWIFVGASVGFSIATQIANCIINS
jgi:hypothetical protein